jgi:urease accessory protein
MHDRVAFLSPDKASVAGAARIGIGGPVGSGKTALIERLIPTSPS